MSQQSERTTCHPTRTTLSWFGWLVVALACVALGCGGGTSAAVDAAAGDAWPADTAADTGAGEVSVDAEVTDTQEEEDTEPVDTGAQDTGVEDTGVEDTRVEDTGAQDTGVEDTGVEDTGVEDTGAQDTGVEDTGAQDTGVQDTGAQDTGPADTGPTLKQDGEACTDSGECESDHCVDEVCCATACDGICQVCNLSGSEGTFSDVADGDDPDEECPGDHFVCGGVCDGAGHCFFAAPDVSCGEIQCEDDTTEIHHTCDGLGECVGEPSSCVPYRCDADSSGTCFTSCSGVEQCANPTDYHCDPADNTCKAGQKLEDGAACGQDDICLSGHCVDDVCCDKECDGLCETCNLDAAHKGICTAVPNNSDPDGDCGLGDCAGSCNGTGACQFPTEGDLCGECQVCEQGVCVDAPNGKNPHDTCGDHPDCEGECQDGHCEFPQQGEQCGVCQRCDEGECVDIPDGYDYFNDCRGGEDDNCDSHCDNGACVSNDGDLCGPEGSEVCRECQDFDCVIIVDETLICAGDCRYCVDGTCEPTECSTSVCEGTCDGPSCDFAEPNPFGLCGDLPQPCCCKGGAVAQWIICPVEPGISCCDESVDSVVRPVCCFDPDSGFDSPCATKCPEGEYCCFYPREPWRCHSTANEEDDLDCPFIL